MDSQIFDTPKSTHTRRSQSSCLSAGNCPAVQWLSILLLIAAVILFPERPAWGDSHHAKAKGQLERDLYHGIEASAILQDATIDPGCALYRGSEEAAAVAEKSTKNDRIMLFSRSRNAGGPAYGAVTGEFLESINPIALTVSYAGDDMP